MSSEPATFRRAIGDKTFWKLFPETRFVAFNRRQDRLLFFSIVDELVGKDDVVLDLGAGRDRFAEFGAHLDRISRLKSRCKRVIGVDVDPIVLTNQALDEAHVIVPGERLPFADGSIDLIYSYAVLEHVDTPTALVDEIARVLKPGGWFCAWTPNKWGYVAIGARLVPNSLHARLLQTVQPQSRTQADVFPTRYRLNTLGTVRRLFGARNFESFSFRYNAQPSYNLGRVMVARFWLLVMALAPASMSQSLMVFERKRSA